MNRIKNYATPLEPYNRDRSEFPYLCGDVFINSAGDELTLIQAMDGAALCVLRKVDGTFTREKFANIYQIFDSGYVQNMEFLQKEVEIASTGIYAPRRLKDGTWAGLTRLMYTTAICVEFGEIVMYESRYCFGHTEVMYSWHLAAYWLAQFASKESLPVGNCAYRGHLGRSPILSNEITDKYYTDLNSFRDKPKVDGMELHEYASFTMANLIRKKSKAGEGELSPLLG